MESGNCEELFRDAVFFVLRTQHAVDGVGGAAAGLVVVANLHFAEQADRQQVQAAEQQSQSGHHERAVFGNYWDVAQEFLRSEPNHDSAAAEDAHHADAAEKVQRPREIAQQEADGQQIEEDAEGTRDAVVRNAALAVYVADRDFANRRAMPRGESRDEPVQFAVEWNLLENVAAR